MLKGMDTEKGDIQISDGTYFTVCNIIGISLMLLLSASTLPPLLRATLRSDGSVSTLSARLRLSRAVAVGIDFLVLADLIESLTVSEHGWSALLKLAAVLLIRAFISWERMIETGHVSAEHAEAMSDAAVDEGGAKSAKAKAKSH